MIESKANKEIFQKMKKENEDHAQTLKNLVQENEELKLKIKNEIDSDL